LLEVVLVVEQFHPRNIQVVVVAREDLERPLDFQ
jgi:hypothetical protein